MKIELLNGPILATHKHLNLDLPLTGINIKLKKKKRYVVILGTFKPSRGIKAVVNSKFTKARSIHIRMFKKVFRFQ